MARTRYKSWLNSASCRWSALVFERSIFGAELREERLCKIPVRFRQRILTTDLRLISPIQLHQPLRPPDLSTPLALQTFLVFIFQHVISLMESSSTAALLQNAIRTTISGSTLINAGRDVVLHGPLPAAGTSRFYNPSIPPILLMTCRSSQVT